jgi:hypothetical protein
MLKRKGLFCLFHCLVSVMLGFELRDSCLPGRYSITQITPSALFALVILETGSRFLPRLAWTFIFLFYTSGVVARMTNAYHHVHVTMSIEMGSHNLFFSRLVWNHNSLYEPPMQLGKVHAWCSVIGWYGIWLAFLPGLALSCSPPDFSLPSS